MTFNKILVPLDGSDMAKAILPVVTGVAMRTGAELVLLGVTGLSGTGRSPGDRVQGYLDSEAARLRKHDISVSVLVESGIAAEVIVEVSTRESVDLVAMATHRESVLGRGILGSVTDRVLRTASVPVLAINPEREGTDEPWIPRTVIVPLDGSDLAQESVPVAIGLAKCWNAKLVFLQAVHIPGFAVSGEGAEFYGASYGVAGDQDRALAYLEQFVKLAEKEGVEASSHAALGNPAARIIEESRHDQDAMIVISSHGRGGFKRMILGSVADKLVRSSHHPVLVMRHAECD